MVDESLKNYLDAVRSMVAFFGFGGAEDDSTSAENGLLLANLAATTQHAYDTLHRAGYSLRSALQEISFNPVATKVSPISVHSVQNSAVSQVFVNHPTVCTIY